MTAQALLSTAEELLAGDRGTLAMAESTVTCHRRSVAAARAQETGGRVGELASACLNAVNLPSRAGVLWAHGCEQMARRGARSTAGERTAA